MENNMTPSRAEKLDKIFGTPLFAVLLAIFCNVLWGSAFPFIKLGGRPLHIYRPTRVQLNRSCTGSGEVQRRHAYDECPQKFRQTDP